MMKSIGIIFTALWLLWFGFRFVFSENKTETSERKDSLAIKKISVSDDGLVLPLGTKAQTVREILAEQKIPFTTSDWIFPPPEAKVFGNATLFIRRAKNVQLTVGDKSSNFITYQTQKEQFLSEQKVSVGEDDIVLPKETETISDRADVQVIRVEVREDIREKSIPFDTETKEDDRLGWRKTIVEQEGKNGLKQFVYRVLLHNGKEMGRKLLREETVREPVGKRVVQGTKVEVGKTHTGLGTWYAHTGTLAAASPWLPFGSFARVTNTENGKQVIVKINDRGPFGKNRIIDLDKVAFEKISSLGAGVISVRVEEIVN